MQAIHLDRRFCQRLTASFTNRQLAGPSHVNVLNNLTHVRHYTPIKSLQDAFRDPSSPFHIPRGKQGPAHENDHDHMTESEVAEAERLVAEEGRRKLLELGYDPTSFWEQQVVWGDHDSFQHVNNVRYVRFFESGRIKWMTSLGDEIGGPEKAEAMLKGNGISLILKSISVNFKRPVTYPDTLLIAHKPHTKNTFSSSPTSTSGAEKNGFHTPDSTESEERKLKLPKTHFHALGVAYSYAQRRIVTESDSVLVWYDYDRLTKCDPGEKARAVLQRRLAEGLARQHEAAAANASS